jgi:hypothetical protein
VFLFCHVDDIKPETYCSEPDCMTPQVDIEMVMELANDEIMESVSDHPEENWGFYCFAWCFERVIYCDGDDVDDVAGLLLP